jgi:predicted ATP-dependent endonuclease of OLD family
MRISFVTINNFRKLKAVKIDFSSDKTLFVGANNSGKTSAMDALRKFLIQGEGNRFIFNDFTITLRPAISQHGEGWIEADAQKPTNVETWLNIVPFMDVWLNVNNDEFHYVAHIIPTLDWQGGELGVRFCFLPKDIGILFDDYRAEYDRARQTEKSDESGRFERKLYPLNLCDFIERNINKYFELRAFILDPAKKDDNQRTDLNYECENKNPFKGLIKIDMIDAQRGLADVDSSNDVVSLSRQFRSYYDKHLDIDKATSPEDLETLIALDVATSSFNKTLKEKFSDALGELEVLGYPGITDPKISIESKIKETTAFEHDSAIQYALSDNEDGFRLPEKYNGLGYQNLISIVFRLISFRDDRIHKGKAKSDNLTDSIVPLHLVLLEEPEAHLHVQVQQVLIKKAYEVLTKNIDSWLTTQLIVSTHSSHIAKEVDFNHIRYFKRIAADTKTNVSISTVVSLRDTFGKDDEGKRTEKFVQRYIQVTHCDLFFADAAIFVEGTAENVLVPYFIRSQFPDLDSRYITVLPVGGRHSHRFKPLIERLELAALIITDIDSAEADGHHKAAIPKLNSGLITGNSSISDWGIKETSFDQLIGLSDEQKVLRNGMIRLAYQSPVNVSINSLTGEALSSTFEETLIYANLEEISKLDLDGVVKKVKMAIEKSSLADFCKDIYDAIHSKSSDKVSFALELMYVLKSVIAPPYIAEGLKWLQILLKRQDSTREMGGVDDEK